MFHANCWGLPYGAVMTGTKMVFPGPHLHPDDLLDLIKAEPPTLSLGVPTIWLGLIQRYEQALAEEPGRWKLPEGMRSMVGGSAVPEALIRTFDRHGVWLVQGWGMTETSPLATVSVPRGEPGSDETLQARRHGRRAGAAGRRAHPRRRRPRRALGRQERRRDPGARPVHHRLVPRRAGQRREVHRRRVAAHRRRRGDGRAGLRAHHRPHQGPDQVGRRVDLLGRPRERADGAPGDRRGGGDRDPRSEVERTAARLHRRQAGAGRRRRRCSRRRSARTCSATASPSGSCPTATR